MLPAAVSFFNSSLTSPTVLSTITPKASGRLESGSASIARTSLPVVDNSFTRVDDTIVLPVPPFPLTAIIT